MQVTWNDTDEIKLCLDADGTAKNHNQNVEDIFYRSESNYKACNDGNAWHIDPTLNWPEEGPWVKPDWWINGTTVCACYHPWHTGIRRCLNCANDNYPCGRPMNLIHPKQYYDGRFWEKHKPEVVKTMWRDREAIPRLRAVTFKNDQGSGFDEDGDLISEDWDADKRIKKHNEGDEKSISHARQEGATRYSTNRLVYLPGPPRSSRRWSLNARAILHELVQGCLAAVP